jgi:hypothetical protein
MGRKQERKGFGIQNLEEKSLFLFFQIMEFKFTFLCKMCRVITERIERSILIQVVQG